MYYNTCPHCGAHLDIHGTMGRTRYARDRT